MNLDECAENIKEVALTQAGNIVIDANACMKEVRDNPSDMTAMFNF